MCFATNRSEFYTIHRDSERQQKMITEGRKTFSACTGSKLVTIAGIELCADLSYPNASLVDSAPYFPITGPVSASITLHKRDLKMTGYKFEARSTHVRIHVNTTVLKRYRLYVNSDHNTNKCSSNILCIQFVFLYYRTQRKTLSACHFPPLIPRSTDTLV